MSQIIDRNIDDNEIIIRHIFTGDFKKNVFTIGNIIEKDVFLDTRFPEVSLLRTRYNDKENCIKRGYDIKPDFVGYLVFKKSVFEEVVKNLKMKESKDFEAIILSTPLDINFNIIPVENIVTIETPVNPGHADLKYINPGLLFNDENPNIAIRRFSRKLFKSCKICFNVDNNHDEVLNSTK